MSQGSLQDDLFNMFIPENNPSILTQGESAQITEIATKCIENTSFQNAQIRYIARNLIAIISTIILGGCVFYLVYSNPNTFQNNSNNLVSLLIISILFFFVLLILTFYRPNIYPWKFIFAMNDYGKICTQKIHDAIDTKLLGYVGRFFGENCQLDVIYKNQPKLTFSEIIQSVSNNFAKKIETYNSLSSREKYLIKHRQLGVINSHSIQDTYTITWTKPQLIKLSEFLVIGKNGGSTKNRTPNYSHYYLLSYTANNKIFLPENDFICIKHKTSYTKILFGSITIGVCLAYSLMFLIIAPNSIDIFSTPLLVQILLFGALGITLGFFGGKRIFFQNLHTTGDLDFDKKYRVEGNNKHIDISLIHTVLRTNLLKLEGGSFSCIYISGSTVSISQNFGLNGLFKMGGSRNKEEYIKKLLHDFESIKKLSFILLRNF